MLPIDAPLERIAIKGYDGTGLCVWRAGRGKHRWLLPPGLGTPVLSWKYLFEYFQDRMTIVTWDPRGCFESGKPSDLTHLTVWDHTEDALSVVNAVGWGSQKFVAGGWSMGVEIGLEIWRCVPGQVLALTLINGTFEHVMKTAFGFPKADVLLRGLTRGAARMSPVFAPLATYLLGRSWAIPLLKNLGLVAENADFFGEVLKEFRNLDFETYFQMILQTDEHSARDILPTVTVPTLITVGTGDKMTPVSIGHFMHEQIEGSELFVIPNGTHYTTLEYPEIVNLKVEQFFRNRVFGKNF